MTDLFISQQTTMWVQLGIVPTMWVQLGIVFREVLAQNNQNKMSASLSNSVSNNW